MFVLGYVLAFALGYVIHGWLWKRVLKQHGFWSIENLRFSLVSNTVFALIFYVLPYVLKEFLYV